MENVIERMNRIDAKTKIGHFIAKERLPYDFKVKYAKLGQKNLCLNVLSVIWVYTFHWWVG